MKPARAIGTRVGVALLSIFALTGGELPHQNLSGTYTYHQRGMAGRMTIQDRVGEPVRVMIETNKITPRHDVCWLNLRPVRGNDGSLSGPAVDGDGAPIAEPSCMIRISPVRPGCLSVIENQCKIAVCGVHAGFDGDYRRLPAERNRSH